MSHSYTQNVVDVIFSTKERRPTIPAEFQARLWAYAAGICREEGMFVHAVGGMADHAHLLVQIPASMALAKAVGVIKANSSKWAHEQGQRFSWQQGYAAFSVSASVAPTVVRYIRNQETHHRQQTFIEEYTDLLKKFEIEYNEQYIFKSLD